MPAAILRRLIQLPLILLIVYTITLALAWAVPGNPLERGDRRPPPEVVEAMQRRYNLHSFWSFYGTYLERAAGVAHVRDRCNGRFEEEDRRAAAAGLPPPDRSVFDLGPSLQYRDQRVNDILADALPVSMTLGAAAVVLGLFIGLAAGVIGAVRPGSLADGAATLLALVGVSVPTFVIGTVLLAVFAVGLGWFPVGGWGGLRTLFLPALTLSLPIAAYIARLSRVGMIEALASDYVRTARAKGLPERVVVLRHALRNALLPVLSYLGPAAAGAMTGSFVVEAIFYVPGMGQHFVAAVQNKDLFLIIGVVLVYATMLIIFNLAVDVMYRWVDPRIA